MTLRTRTTALLALLLSAPLALAAPPSEAQIDRLLEVMRAEQTVEAVLPQVRASQQQLVEQATRNASPAQREAAMQAAAASLRAVESTLSWESLQPVYRDIYVRTFSAEDTDAMVAFYSSPAGQNLLDKMPLLMQNTMTAVQGLVLPMLERLQHDLQQQLDDATPVDVP